MFREVGMTMTVERHTAARPAKCGLAVLFGGFNRVSGKLGALLKSYIPASEVEGVHSLRLAFGYAGIEGVL
jgi:hypothetical protein